MPPRRSSTRDNEYTRDRALVTSHQVIRQATARTAHSTTAARACGQLGRPLCLLGRSGGLAWWASGLAMTSPFGFERGSGQARPASSPGRQRIIQAVSTKLVGYPPGSIGRRYAHCRSHPPVLIVPALSLDSSLVSERHMFA